MKKFIFIDRPDLKNLDTAFIAHLTIVLSTEQLFEELSEKLKFPGYFGYNWDALYDCLRDFNWINEKEIMLVHDSLPKLEVNDLRVYLTILYDSINDWKENEDHVFNVAFLNKDKHVIEKIMTD